MTLTQDRPTTDAATSAADFRCLLVHVEPGLAATHRVVAAAALARSLDARLIGLGAETLDPFPAPDPMAGYGAGEWLVLMQEQVTNDLQSAAEGFRRDAAEADTEWRSVQDYPTRAMARLARAADLLVVSPRNRAGAARAVDPAELVLTAGRPVLMAPEGGRHFRGKTVVVGWKDAREARRAVADALPFLRRADEVLVQTVRPRDETDAAQSETADVVAALKRHGVQARAIVSPGHVDDAPELLAKTAHNAGADLIVVGGYGHSRAREWVFGGVTDVLIHNPPCFVLFSH